MATFAQHMGVKVDRVNAAPEFLRELAGVADPEQKRRIIGRLFVEAFQREAKKLPNAKWLAQGTIYPTSSSRQAPRPRSGQHQVHHNVGGLPESLHLKLLEPLRELFKDEVRALGLTLGFRATWSSGTLPGAGLGVRILGEVKAEYASLCSAPTPSSSRNCATRSPRRRTVVRQGRAGLRRVPAGAKRGRDGRRAHLRLRRGAPGRRDDGLHDRALASSPTTSSGASQPHHQRGAGHQSRRLRYFEQTAGDDRVGVGSAIAADARSPVDRIHRSLLARLNVSLQHPCCDGR